MKFTVEGINLDTMNYNGRIYTTESVTKALDEWNKCDTHICYFNCNDNLFGQYEFGLIDAAGKINSLCIEDKSLVADIELIDTPRGNLAKEIINAGCLMILVPTIWCNQDNGTYNLSDILFVNFVLDIQS